MILSYAFALIYGVYCGIGSTMSNLLNPFGFSPTQISIAGGSCLSAGVVGALMVGVFLDYTQLYRLTHLTISFMTLFSCILTMLVLHTSEGILGPIMASTITLGISSVSFFPTSLSYGAELTFPLQPALVNSCMNFLGQVSAFILMWFSAYMTEVKEVDDITAEGYNEQRKKNSFIVIVIFSICCFITSILACFIKEDLRRINFKKVPAEDSYQLTEIE